MSAAADRLSDPKIRARVQELEGREDLGPFLYAAANSIQEVPPLSSYRYTFTRRTLTYRELGVIGPDMKAEREARKRFHERDQQRRSDAQWDES